MPNITDINKLGEDIVRAEATSNAVPVKKTRGKPPQSRAGLIQTDEDRLLVSQLLGEVLHEYKKPKVKSDEELQNRLNEYFQHCADTGQVPTVEEMCLTTGYTYWWFNDIVTGRRKGFSPETAETLKKARAFLMTFDAKLAVSGKMNFLAYCFRAKNYYGMVDKQEHVITPNTTDETEVSKEDLLKRYALDDNKTVETTLEDA